MVVSIFIFLFGFMFSPANLAIVEMLLEHGASVNAQQASGVTALMMAAEQVSHGQCSIVFCVL